MKSTRLLLLLSALLLAAPLTRAQIPPAPTLITATATFYYVPDIYLSWHGPDNSVGTVTYRIYRSLGDTTQFELVGTSYYSTYVDFQIVGNQTYYYYITSNVVRDSIRYESDRSSFVSAIAVPQGGGGGGGGSKRKNNGTIAGRVTDSLTGKPILAAVVSFYRISSSGVPVQKVVTDGSGHYKAALDTGSYILKAQPPLSGGATNYRTEWYKDASDPADAMHIQVDDTSRIVADIDLSAPGATKTATVSGTVRDSAGLPLSGARVFIMLSIQQMEELSSSGEEDPGVGAESFELEGMGHAQGVVWRGVTDALGNFQGTAPTGQDCIVLASKDGYVPQFFNHQPDPTTASLLLLTSDTTGIDFNLQVIQPDAQYTVSGFVGDSNGVHVPSRVVLFPLSRQSADAISFFAYTDTLGAFTTPHVRPGRYVALALPFSLYAPAYYRAGYWGTSRWENGDTLTVAGNVAGIDIGVDRITLGGIYHISGRVTSEKGPARGVNVYARFANASYAGYGITDDEGFYSISGLPSEQISLSGDLEGYQTAQRTISIAPGNLSVSSVDLALTSSVTGVAPVGGSIARQFVLDQNYPNPFNPTTTIAYEVPVASSISIRIYSVTGQEVAELFEGVVSSGRHEANWNGKDRNGSQVASGVYFYRYSASPVSGGSAVQLTRKMMMIK